MVVLYVMSNGSAEENLRQIFRIFDINSDGTISQKELQKIVKDLFHLLKKDGDPAKESEVRKTSLPYSADVYPPTSPPLPILT